jgi:hypothetical protein
VVVAVPRAAALAAAGILEQGSAGLMTVLHVILLQVATPTPGPTPTPYGAELVPVVSWALLAVVLLVGLVAAAGFRLLIGFSRSV